MSDDQQFHRFRAPVSAPHLRSTFRTSFAASSTFAALFDSPLRSVSEPAQLCRGGALQGDPSRTTFPPEYSWTARWRERLSAASQQWRPVAGRDSLANGAAREPFERQVSRRGPPPLPAHTEASSLGREPRGTPRWKNPPPEGRPACVTCGIVA